MKINISTNISDEYKDINIIINAPNTSEEVKQIIETLMQINTEKKQIIASKDSKNYIIPVSEIISFYSEDKYTYCRTNKDTYKVKERLYELEKLLDKNFVRISNSCIINLEFVECFAASFSGTIEVVLKDKSKEYVSRRRVNEVLKKIKERGI